MILRFGNSRTNISIDINFIMNYAGVDEFKLYVIMFRETIVLFTFLKNYTVLSK